METVTAVTPNEEIDDALVERAREVLERDDPELLVLQTLSVDQTGHARGSYYPEYLERIEATDRLLEEFVGWCREEGYLDGATVIVTCDHGQGRGIGGHGHLTEPERRVPFLAWGEGVPRGVRIEDARSLLDVAPTLAYYLGAPPPAQSVGQVLFTPEGVPARHDGPLAIVIPAYNEAEVLPEVLARIPRAQLGDAVAIVVDDGSTDGTAGVAERAGADLVVRHERNRGLGAALRTGLETARGLDARAAVYLDADLEYDPPEIPARRTTGTRAGRSTAAPTPAVVRTPPPTAVGATSAPARRSTTPSRRPSPRASRRSSPGTPMPPRRPRTRSCGRSRSPTCRRRSATPTSSTATSREATPTRPASTRPRAGRSTACSSRSSRRSTPTAATIASYYDLAAGAPWAGAGEAVQAALESAYGGLGISADEIGTLQ